MRLRRRLPRFGWLRNLRAEFGKIWEIAERVALQFGDRVEAVRSWGEAGGNNKGVKPGILCDDATEIQRLGPEPQKMKRTNEILRKLKVSLGRSKALNNVSSGIDSA